MTVHFVSKSWYLSRYTLNICKFYKPRVQLDWQSHTGDIGGQRTLRPYWRNYFERTDAIVWVVDTSDRLRIRDCRTELHSLLVEEVLSHHPSLHSLLMRFRGYWVPVYLYSLISKISQGHWVRSRLRTWVLFTECTQTGDLFAGVGSSFH